jgi:hypothetical protein
MFFPSIILNKIYWYQWHNLQSKLCIEYRQKIVFNERTQWTTLCININDDNTYVSHLYKPYNYRILLKNGQRLNDIYRNELREGSVADLPINYVYSNGI